MGDVVDDSLEEGERRAVGEALAGQVAGEALGGTCGQGQISTVYHAAGSVGLEGVILGTRGADIVRRARGAGGDIAGNAEAFIGHIIDAEHESILTYAYAIIGASNAPLGASIATDAGSPLCYRKVVETGSAEIVHHAAGAVGYVAHRASSS